MNEYKTIIFFTHCLKVILLDAGRVKGHTENGIIKINCLSQKRWDF